jgi:hypothetical protein
MSRAAWKLCPVSSISLAQLDEGWIDLRTGYLDRAKWPDCDLFAKKAVVQAAFGVQVNVARGLNRLQSDPRFHRYELLSDDGKLVGLATAQSSVSWLGAEMTVEAGEISLENLKPFRAR